MSRQKTKRQLFLEEMEQALPWGTFSEVINRYYEKTSGVGRPKKELILMLKIHFLQQWYNLSDPGVEEAIVDSEAFRHFVDLPLIGDEVPCPDETTILRFRHFLEEHGLQEKLFIKVNKIFEEKGYIHKEGTIVDSTIIKASSSTKNKDKKRDPEMSSTKKNNNYSFGAKEHIGSDTDSGLIHSSEVTTAKTADITMFDECHHGKEKASFGDKAYGSKERKKQYRKEGKFYGITEKATTRRKLSSSQKKRNKQLSSVRSKVEHPFGIIKYRWGHTKTRYKGLTKLNAQWKGLCMLYNLYKMRKTLIENPL